jgi:hypothetical protein
MISPLGLPFFRRIDARQFCSRSMSAMRTRVSAALAPVTRFDSA